MSKSSLNCFALAAGLRVGGSLTGLSSICGQRCAQRHVHAAGRRTRSASVTAMASPVGTNEHDVLLGELAFTEPDLLPALVQSRMDKLDEEFYTFIEGKINASSDLEERETLRMLLEAVKDLQGQVLSGQHFDSAPGTSSAGGATAPAKPVTLDDLNALADETYDALIDRLVRAREEDGDSKGDVLATTVKVTYEEIDKRFLDRLEARIQKGDNADDLSKVKNAITSEMSSRMNEAAGKVKAVLTAESPDAMRKQIEMLAVKGGVDDAFVLLLQGNIQQAKQAGATPAVQVLSSALEHAALLKDSRLPPEVRLIRRLIRTDDSEARESILTEALTPRRTVLLADGTKSTGVRVNGKKFVTALRELIEKYGNVEKEFVQRLLEISEESEAVARKVFDMEDKDVQDMQDEAFAKRSVSVWDLEKVEMAEEMEGRKPAWEGRLGNIPHGFDEQGKLTI